MKAGTDGIDGDQIAALVRTIEVYRFNNKEFFAVKRGSFCVETTVPRMRAMIMKWVRCQSSVFSAAELITDHWTLSTIFELPAVCRQRWNAGEG